MKPITFILIFLMLLVGCLLINGLLEDDTSTALGVKPEIIKKSMIDKRYFLTISSDKYKDYKITIVDVLKMNVNELSNLAAFMSIARCGLEEDELYILSEKLLPMWNPTKKE